MNLIIDFLNCNSGAIQAILVFVLVIITIWYAASSKKMTQIMKKQYASSIKPYLYPAREVERIYSQTTNYRMQLVFSFINLSNVAISYYIDELILQNTSINPPKDKLVLFPQQKGYLYSNEYISDNNFGKGDGMRGVIKVIFWDSENAMEKYSFKREFTLGKNDVVFSNSEEYRHINNKKSIAVK